MPISVAAVGEPSLSGAPPQAGYGYPPGAPPVNSGYGPVKAAYGAGSGAAYEQPAPAATYPPRQQQYQGAGQPYSGGGLGLGGGIAVNIDPDMNAAMQFAETRVRNAFVRKVFAIVAIQLAVTVGITAAFIYVMPIKVSITAAPCVVV